jgi:hypothetical protein
MLVALAILAVALTPIGGLIASSVRGARSIEGHLTQLETARTAITALPDRNQLVVGDFSGRIGDHSWRVDVMPFSSTDANSQQNARWVPQSVVVTIGSLSGPAMKINTIRLRRSGNQ